MDIDTILVSLSHLPHSICKHVKKLVLFASAVDSAVSLLEFRVSKNTNNTISKEDSDESSKKCISSSDAYQSDQNVYSKAILSLRRLNLCFCDLFDMLESCVETIDVTKKRSIYLQIEPSVVLIKNSLSDIQQTYSNLLEKEGISFSFSEVNSGLDQFCTAVHKESDLLLSHQPTTNHPNLLVIMTSGLSIQDIEDSINRYIPRSDCFPCDDQPLSIPAFAESDLSGSYIRPSSPGLLDWSPSEADYLSNEDDQQRIRTKQEELTKRSSSPSIGQPIPCPNIAHFARISTVFPHHYNASGCECPGRASLLTGQYPPIHGVRTSKAKTGCCSELKVDEVPTLGHYLRCAGYDIVYKGEWGLSQVQALQEHPILDLLGVERDVDEDLQPFGFDGWQAHDDDEDWYDKSVHITSEAIDYIRRRDCVMSSMSLRGSEPPPWGLVVSYPDILPDLDEVNKDMNEQLIDITKPVWSLSNPINSSMSCGNLRQMEEQRKLNYSTVLEKSDEESKEYAHLPSIQKQYKQYCQRMQNNHAQEIYKLNRKRLDSLCGELFQEVLRGTMNNTLILFTSVSGNSNGQHDLWGSCYNGYEPSLHIPCILYTPALNTGVLRTLKENIMHNTSAIDIIPTLFSLMNIQYEDIQSQLRITHHSIPPFPGCNLCQTYHKDDVIYYQSEDVKMPITRTASCSLLDTSSTITNDMRSIAVLIKRIQTGHLMKLCYYSSDPRTCDCSNRPNQYGEWELYDMTWDPNEKHNCIYDEEYKEIMNVMKKELAMNYVKYCEVSNKHEKRDKTKKFSLFRALSVGTSKEVKWQQFYILVIALVVSIIAILIQYFIS